MGNPLIGENLFLLYSIGMGVFVTFVYDLLRSLRRAIPHNNFFVSVEDIFFWIFCAISVFLMMQKQSDGTLRWFAVGGALLGMFVYRKTFSKLLVRFLSGILKWILKWLGRFLRLLGRPIGAAGRQGRKFFRRFRPFLKKRLTRLRKMLRMILCKR